jgi:membrane protein required for colicin V production
MPSYFDLGLIGVVLISALLSMLRGFTREVLAIASWALAAVAAYYLHPYALPYIKPYIQKDTVALAVAALSVFIVTLILVSIITVKLSDVILDSKIGALDRSLGFLFGAVRGFLLAVIAFLFFSWLVPDKSQPEWVKAAKTKPILQATGDQIMAMLPDDPESTILKRLKKPKAGTDEAPPEPDPETKTGPAAPAVPQKKTEIAPPPSSPVPAAHTGLTQKAASQTNVERQKLDALIADPGAGGKLR